MKATPGKNPEAALARDQDNAQVERERYDREMRHMGRLIKWLDHHEHWFLREARWRDQGRIS